MALQSVPGPKGIMIASTTASLGTANKKIETIHHKMKKQLPYVQNDISIIKERNNALSPGIVTQSIFFFLSICLECCLDNNG